MGRVGATRRRETLSARSSDIHSAALRAGSAKPEIAQGFRNPEARQRSGGRGHDPANACETFRSDSGYRR